MAFSGALTITDLDDFLTPSQACIIPVRGPKNTGKEHDGPTEIQIDSNNNYYEVSTYPTSVAGPSSGAAKANGKQALEKAEINLNDCLACSGCITSTESMLITMQSHNEVLHFIAHGNTTVLPASTDGTARNSEEPSRSHTRTPVLSISPQTLASLSASYSSSGGKPPIPLVSLLRRIRAFLAHPSRGGWRTWDTTFARHISLRESVVEYQERLDWAKRDKGKQVDRGGAPDPGPLPLLASACPGWVCYAEKAQGDMLPMMSGARSSQGIMGALAKTWWGGKMSLSPDHIYHVTAMPCYDKKLEASRSDFYSSMYSTRDVDCVLTTGELDLLLSDLGFDPHQPVEGENASTPASDLADRLSSPWPEMLQHPGTSSGSYLHTIINYLSARHPNPTTTTVREIRGSTDNVEYLLEDAVTGEVIFKGAKCYGFRNLQNLVRKVGKETGLIKGRGGAGASKLSAAIAARRKKKVGTSTINTPDTPGTPVTPMSSNVEGSISRVNGLVHREEKKLDFVEVMACPGGCVNGGGQMKPVQKASAIGQAVDGMEVDEEGYPRPMADEGVELVNPKEKEGADEGMRWSTKEWVEKVERIYWSGLPTPPPSPPTVPQDLNGSAIVMPNGQAGKADRLWQGDQYAKADDLMDRIVNEACGNDMGKRWEFLRTRFMKVEGDILQSGVTGVTHEAVKW